MIIKGVDINYEKINDETVILLGVGKYKHKFEITEEDNGYSFCWVVEENDWCETDTKIYDFIDGIFISSYRDFNLWTVKTINRLENSDYFPDYYSNLNNCEIFKEGCIIMRVFFEIQEVSKKA